MTKEQLAAHGDAHDHGHEHDESPWNTLTLFFAASTGLLLILLIASAVMKRKPAIA